jgi:hypothetical protein
MPGSFLETDLPVFTNTDEFGEAATWTPDGGVATTVNGQFFDLNMNINPFTGENETNVDALFVCAVSDVPGIKQGEAMVIDSVTYYVKTVPSSQSDYMYHLKLRKA